MRCRVWIPLLAGIGHFAAAYGGEKQKPGTELEQYLTEAGQRGATMGGERAVGSTYAPSLALADLVRDLRASRVDDLVTVVVSDRASAIAKGVTNSSRKSDVSSGVGAFLGKPSSAGALANLAKSSGESQIQGQGQTSRETVLTATLSARVVQVLPNGNLVIEGSKLIRVNSEQQWITLRGIVRTADVQPGNIVRSDRLSHLEVQVNGKGVVGDAVRRPFFLYRLLLGILPL